MNATITSSTRTDFVERRSQPGRADRRRPGRTAAWTPALHSVAAANGKRRHRPVGVMAGILMTMLMWALVGGQAMSDGGFDTAGLSLATTLTLALLPLAWLERGR